MGASGVDPSRKCGLEIGQTLPDGAGHREFRKWLLRLYHVDLVDNHPKSISQVDDRDINGRHLAVHRRQAERDTSFPPMPRG